jgi:hypothetical protein
MPSDKNFFFFRVNDKNMKKKKKFKNCFHLFLNDKFFFILKDFIFYYFFTNLSLYLSKYFKFFFAQIILF